MKVSLCGIMSCRRLFERSKLKSRPLRFAVSRDLNLSHLLDRYQYQSDDWRSRSLMLVLLNISFNDSSESRFSREE